MSSMMMFFCCSRCSEFDGGISMADVLVSAALVHSQTAQTYRSTQKQRATSKYLRLLSGSCGGIGGFGV
jgi:hypothetical protein